LSSLILVVAAAGCGVDDGNLQLEVVTHVSDPDPDRFGNPIRVELGTIDGARIRHGPKTVTILMGDRCVILVEQETVAVCTIETLYGCFSHVEGTRWNATPQGTCTLALPGLAEDLELNRFLEEFSPDPVGFSAQFFSPTTMAHTPIVVSEVL
jgi:hypothetical protein